MTDPFANEEAEEDLFVPDLSNVKSDLIPEGEYFVEAVGLQETRTKSSNERMWQWELEILEGEYRGRKLVLSNSFSPRALPMLMRAVVALRIYTDEDGWLTRKKSEMLGAIAIAVVKHEKYEGETRHKLARLKKCSDEDLERLSDGGEDDDGGGHDGSSVDQSDDIPF